MHIGSIASGVYVIAVSGGVDSVVLLDMLSRQKDLTLIVAHVDHGIRNDSADDAVFVGDLAQKYGLQFECQTLNLGLSASEDTARRFRYNFLQGIRKKYSADAIITAHHQDDVLETIVINLTRGTGWRGLVSLRSHATLLRPMLRITKVDIVQYARERGLDWREDSTNTDTKYLRNRIRRAVIPKLRTYPAICDQLVNIWEDQLKLEQGISLAVSELLSLNAVSDDDSIEIARYPLIMLPRAVSVELLQEAVRHVSGHRLQQKQVDRLLLFAKTAKSHKTHRPEKSIVCRATSTSFIVSRVSVC